MHAQADMLDDFSGATRVIFIVGDPIAQVKSPAGVTEMLRERGVDTIVVPAHVLPVDLPVWVAATTRMRNVDGIIVTVPHKFAAAELCHETSSQAHSIGAVNVMRRHAAGGWYGDMLDGTAYIAGLRQTGFDPAGKRTLLLGAGGAGSAIAHALVDAGVATLALHDADVGRQEALLHKLALYGPVKAMPGSTDPTDFDLVINATPLGMQADDLLPIDVDRLAASTFVGDVVTMPAVPPLIAAARARGCATMTGIQMFEAVRDRAVDFYLHE